MTATVAQPEAGLSPRGSFEVGGTATRRLDELGGPDLRKLLVLIDGVAVTIGWSAALAIPWVGPAISSPTALRPVIAVLLLVTSVLALVGAQRLYLARVCAVRAVEVARLARACVLSVFVAYVATGWTGLWVPWWRLLLGGASSFVLLASCRSLYAVWLRSQRAAGRFSRPVVIVGSNDEGFQLYRLLHSHPELGYRISGVVGRESEVSGWGNDVPWLGGVGAATDAVKATGANGVLIATTALTPEDLNSLSRRLTATGVHVHLSNGLRGIDHRRLRPVPMAYEPLLYLEPVSLARWQLVVKRAVDLALSVVALILTAPFMGFAALLVKLEDRGPVLFRQERVGRNGKPFQLLKLRTMRPDAEEQLSDVRDQNARDGGPLFKARSDPRRTRVGNWLEALSVDELPQLFNVLRGEMSLVGPRPALPSEVEHFDEELLGRLSVLPGVTGLWQAEARDNPRFHAYRRLDLFYVENWSVAFDLAILLATMRSLIVRPFKRR